MFVFIKILILTLFINCAFHNTYSQDVIDFEVVFKENNEELHNDIQYNTQLSLQVEVDHELENIFEQLHYLGFLTAEKVSCNRDSLKVKCTLKPGEKIKYFLEPGNLGEEVKATLSDDKYFGSDGIIPGKYENLTKEILEFLQNNGYPFANVSLNSPKIKGDSIIGKLFVDPSNYIVFDSLQVEGNVNINPRFLAMHTGIKPEKSYSEDVFKNLDDKLKALDFVEITGEPVVLFTETHAEVNVGLEKRSANRFDGIAGVVYDEGVDNAMRLTGQLNLHLINSFERGEWMDFRWQGLGHGTQSLDLTAGYPYLFYSSFMAEMKFRMRKQDSTYLQIERKPALGYRFSNNFSADIFVDWKTSELLEVERYQLADELPGIIDYQTILYGISANYRSELFNIDPREGFNHSIQVAAGNRNIKKNNSLPDHIYDDIELKSNQYTGRLSLQHVFPFMDRSAVFLKGDGGIMIGDGIFDNELFRIGGLNSLRGFDEESILASAYGYFLAEYRYVIGHNSYLSVFANGGFFERKTTSTYKDLPMGAGVGISQELPAGIMSLFFAFGKRQEEPVNFNDVKVHVGFVSTF